MKDNEGIFSQGPFSKLMGAILLAALCLTPLTAGKKQWRSYTKAGKKALKKGDHKEAEKMFLAAFEETDSLELNNNQLVETLLDLAGLYHSETQSGIHQGLRVETLATPSQKVTQSELQFRAEWAFRRAAGLAERSLPADHPDVRIGLNALALLYRFRGQYPLSERVYKRALAIHQRTEGSGPAGAIRTSAMNAASSFQGLAQLYHLQGKYAQAEEFYARTLAAWEPMGPQLRFEVAKNLFNLASVYEALGKYAQAEEALLRALTIWEESGRPSNELIATLDAYAALLRKASRPSEAQVLSDRAQALREKRKQPDGDGRN